MFVIFYRAMKHLCILHCAHSCDVLDFMYLISSKHILRTHQHFVLSGAIFISSLLFAIATFCFWSRNRIIPTLLRDSACTFAVWVHFSLNQTIKWLESWCIKNSCILDISKINSTSFFKIYIILIESRRILKCAFKTKKKTSFRS